MYSCLQQPCSFHICFAQDPFIILSAHCHCGSLHAAGACGGGSGGNSNAKIAPDLLDVQDAEEPEEIRDEDIAWLVRERMQRHRTKCARRRRRDKP